MSRIKISVQQPIRVIAAIGNARVGKSTTLNLISHICDQRSKGDQVKEIFETGDSVKPVTRNVWAHMIQPRSKSGSTLFLDVEGTNLGDDTLTDQLSMFTAMMSSGLIIFARDVVGNSDIDFLYRISRKSDFVFPDKTALQNFPKLQIVVRSNLEYDDDNENYVRDEIFKPNHQTSTQDRGDIINRYFPRDSIAVTHIPSVTDPKILKNLAKLRESSHWDIFDKLVTQLSDLPEKKTFKGSRVDGGALDDLAKKLVKSMNENAWEDFGDLYSTMEKDICRRSYDKHIKPVLMRRSSEMEDVMMDCVDEFKKECFLESEIKNATRDLKMALKETRKREEAEEKRRKEEEEKRKQEENNKWFNY